MIRNARLGRRADNLGFARLSVDPDFFKNQRLMFLKHISIGETDGIQPRFMCITLVQKFGKKSGAP